MWGMLHSAIFRATCVTTKLRDKLHKTLPSVTPLGNVCLNFPVQVTKNLFDMGCYEVSLGDTTGVGAPGKKYSLNNQKLRFVPLPVLTNF